MKKTVFAALCSLVFFHGTVHSRGVSPYLPLHLEPEIERQIERVLILADKPVLTRPIAAATVLDALPKACEIDSALCAEVRRYLHRYMGDWGLTHASIEVAATSDFERNLTNRYGLKSTSAWEVSASGFWQPSDYLIATLGGSVNDEGSEPTGSMLSVGFSRAQLDLGYRPHWLSPMTDSSMLLSTNSLAMPSVTLSNYTPLTRFGFQYEIFQAEMARAPIVFQNAITVDNPRLAGFHLGIEPASGWSLAVNRVMQFGGGGRNESIHDLLNAFFNPASADNQEVGLAQDQEFGNQAASVTSRFLFPGRTPFAVYFEYAGEDTSRGGSTAFGNASLSAGIHFPRLWRQFDFTYETSEWQNGWYVHHIYQQGLTNEGIVIGHWGADQRQFGDGVGAQSHMLRLGWEPHFGGAVELRYRTLANESYSPVEYRREHDISLSYSRPLGPFIVGGEAFASRDVFGEDSSRVAAFFRYSGRAPDRYRDFDEGASSVAAQGAEIFVDAGAGAYQLRINADKDTADITKNVQAAPHFALGARRAISAHNDLGARLELDDIDGNLLIAVRALDYRYRFSGPLTLSAFIGAANYRVATPAIGAYIGVGAQWRNLLPGWDAGLDLRFVSNASRDRLLSSDPVGERPDIFYDIPAATFYLSRKF